MCILFWFAVSSQNLYTLYLTSHMRPHWHRPTIHCTSPQTLPHSREPCSDTPKHACYLSPSFIPFLPCTPPQHAVDMRRRSCRWLAPT